MSLTLWRQIIIDPRSSTDAPDDGLDLHRGNGASADSANGNGYEGANGSVGSTGPLSASPNGGTPASRNTSPRLHEHHSVIELPPLDVDTGQLPIPPEERARIEAEVPVMAGSVEDISEDRAWLSHKLLNPRTIVSFLLGFGIIAFIFTRLNIDPVATWNTMLTADPLYLVGAFVVYYSAFWLRAVRWRQLLRNAGHNGKAEGETPLPSINGLVEIIYLSWFVNCIVPAKLGDAYRSYLLKRNSGVSFSSTIGTILAERVVDLLVLFGLLVASFTLVSQKLSNSKELPLGWVMLLGGMMAVALIVGLVGLRFFGDVLLRLIPHRFRDMFAKFQHGILKSFSRKSLPGVLDLTVVIWFLEGGRLFLVTRSLDAHAVTLSAVIFIALLSSLLTTLPLTPGGAGIVEGAVTVALGLFLKDHQLAVSIAILDRVINYWSLIVGGLVLYLFSKRR